jgi:hypothetical protein
MTRLTDIRKPLDQFTEMFADEIPKDDSLDYYVNRRTDEGETFLQLKTHSNDLISRLVLEEYIVRGRMHGTVITAYPKPTYEIPIFFCQIGGVGDRSIAVLDLSPTTPDVDYSPLIPVHQEYAERLGLEPTTTGWLQSICSPYLLHCNYAELDEDLYVEAMTAYCRVWLDHYYRPAVPVADRQREELVTNLIYKFKFQLHHHDPAYGFFARSWGKPAADAFVQLECGDHPAFLPPTDLESTLKGWHDDATHVVWDEPAQVVVMALPEADQERTRRDVERRALADGFGIITLTLLARYAGTA